MTTENNTAEDCENEPEEHKVCANCLFYYCRFYNTPCEDCMGFCNFEPATKKHRSYERFEGVEHTLGYNCEIRDSEYEQWKRDHRVL